LAKLHEEGKVVLVEPSADVSGAYLRKGQSYISSATLLVRHGKLEEGVSMAYYSMY
jgi:uncharacterized protein (UPF0332 family)